MTVHHARERVRSNRCRFPRPPIGPQMYRVYSSVYIVGRKSGYSSGLPVLSISFRPPSVKIIGVSSFLVSGNETGFVENECQSLRETIHVSKSGKRERSDATKESSSRKNRARARARARASASRNDARNSETIHSSPIIGGRRREGAGNRADVTSRARKASSCSRCASFARRCILQEQEHRITD